MAPDWKGRNGQKPRRGKSRISSYEGKKRPGPQGRKGAKGFRRRPYKRKARVKGNAGEKK